MYDLRKTILDQITKIAGTIPVSTRAPSATPKMAAKELAMTVARHSAAISGGASIIPGIGSTALIAADLIAVLRLQQRMIADISALYDNRQALDEEAMIALLFKDIAPNSVRSLIVGSGPKRSFDIRVASQAILRRTLQRIAWTLARRIAGRAVARLVPVVGAIGAGLGSYRQTLAVGDTAIAFFEGRVRAVKPLTSPIAVSADDTASDQQALPASILPVDGGS